MLKFRNPQELRLAIQAADLPSNTKLVLYNISLYLDVGSCAFFLDKMADETGLSPAMVHKNLKIAEDAGVLATAISTTSYSIKFACEVR